MSTPLIKGSTYRFQLVAKKDGSVWNLGSATVKLYFRKPNGTILTKTATVTDATNGIAQYESVVGDLDVVGSWTRSWEVTDGSVVQETVPIPFVVLDAP